MHGDGIGHEIVPATRQIVDAALSSVHAPPVEWVELPLGSTAIDSHGTPIPDETIDSLGQLQGWILGPHDSASYPERFRGQLTPGGVIRKSSSCSRTSDRQQRSPVSRRWSPTWIW